MPKTIAPAHRKQLKLEKIIAHSIGCIYMKITNIETIPVSLPVGFFKDGKHKVIPSEGDWTKYFSIPAQTLHESKLIVG